MARNGYQVFDSDTHCGPVMEVLDKYITDGERSRLVAWEKYKFMNTTKEDHWKGGTYYTRGIRRFSRALGEAGSDAHKLGGHNTAFHGPKKERIPTPSVYADADPAVRIADMDFEGADVNLIFPSTWFGVFAADEDIELEMGMYRAYHRWQNEYCGAYPNRLGGLINISARDIAGSVEEMRRWSKSRWPWGIMPNIPYGMPFDHPDLEPIWAAAEEFDLAVTLHSYTAAPPYAPGSTDIWDNQFLMRSTGHPWCGMRNMAALIGAGVLDRYPKLRLGTVECGLGWLPFWLARIDEHAETTPQAVPKLKHKPSEYVAEGRYFQSMEIHEGEKMTNAVADLVGEKVIMYASDYPHGECRYPKSVDIVLGWNMPEARKRTMFWNNPVKFYARCGLPLEKPGATHNAAVLASS